jgi:hypothetical protein
MAEQYYAWTRIPVSRNEWGQLEKEIQPGDKVSASDLNVSDEEFQELVDIGAVRTDEYEADEYTPPSRVVHEEPEEVVAVKELRLGQQQVREPEPANPPAPQKEETKQPQGKSDISAQLTEKK